MPAVLGDYFELQRGTTYKSAMLGQAGPVLLGLGSIARNGGFKGDNLKTYGGPCDPRHLLTPGEIYVSLKDVTQSADLLGAVARVPSYIPLGRLTQDTVKLVFKQQDAPRTYLYWLLQAPQYREYCRAHSTGTTNLGLAREDFLNFEVPPLTRERQWIVDLVQNIEDKIELNRRMNKTLERQAQAIFRDWFVDFGPVRRKIALQSSAGGKAAGETDPVAIMGGLTPDPARAAQLAALFPAAFGDDGLPVGWMAGTLDRLAKAARETVNPAIISTDTPYFGLEHLPRQCIMLDDWGYAGAVSSNKTRLAKGQVLFGKLRPYFHKVGIAPIDGVCSTDIVVLDSIRSADRPFVTSCVSTESFVAFTDQGSTGTKMPRTSWGQMKTYPVAIAPEAVRDSYAAIVQPMHDKIVASVHENRTLAETRDYLLPRLMSGAVRVVSKGEAA